MGFFMEVNEIKLVLQTVNYSRNSGWKFGSKIQNHWDNNAFCAVGYFILPHLVHCVQKKTPTFVF